MELDDRTQETLDLVQKALTNGWTTNSGLQGIDLTGVVSLIPVYTPLRKLLSRVGSPAGAEFTQWKALLNVTNSQPSIFTGYDTTGGLVATSLSNVSSPYVPIALDGQVTQDSIDIAKNYADPLAIETMNVLNMLMVLEERALGTGAQAFALPAITTPTATTATTGGTLGTGVTIKCAVQARSGMNYFNGGSGVASTQGTVTTGSTTSTGTVTFSVPAVKGAVAYDWFVGASTANLYYATTTVASLTITKAIPTTNQSLPSYELPDLFGTAPTAPSTADSSFSANAFNSLLATIVGDYNNSGLSIVTPGTGTNSGAGWTDCGASPLTISGASVSQLDALNLSIYNSVKLSPTAYMMNAQQASDLSMLLLGTNLAPTYLQASAAGRDDVTGSAYVSTYINKAFNGAPIRIEVHPSVPPGTIIARTDSVPFPGSNIGNVFEVRTLRDYAQFEYGVTRSPATGPSGPRQEFTIRSVETLVNRAPVSCAVLANIAASE
jgi:hypothetical protein